MSVEKKILAINAVIAAFITVVIWFFMDYHDDSSTAHGGMESRTIVLESVVYQIQEDVGEVKSDVRDIHRHFIQNQEEDQP